MSSQSNEWPSSPDGVGEAGRFDDKELNELIVNIENNENKNWFSKVTPREDPPRVEGLPEKVQKDIKQDHREQLDAAPEEPTESYRKTALKYLNSVREARTRVRPNSLTELENIPEGIRRTTTSDWVYFSTSSEMGTRNDDIPQSSAEVTEDGKYLFFTPDNTGVLETIIFEQFLKRPFESAKVPSLTNQREEIILCLYYGDDRYKDELRQAYQNEEDSWGVASPYDPSEPTIKPRGYKRGR